MSTLVLLKVVTVTSVIVAQKVDSSNQTILFLLVSIFLVLLNTLVLILVMHFVVVFVIRTTIYVGKIVVAPAKFY